jgi:outer membrane protein assembly factor BamA
MRDVPHVLVVGGGGTGGALAHDLQLRGLQVTLVERGNVTSGFIPDDLGMSGAAFVDAGSLFGAGAFATNPANAGCVTGNINLVCLADSSSVRVSAGVSLIWNSPLGPLRLDVAKALKKESYDDEQLIRFGASTRF